MAPSVRSLVRRWFEPLRAALEAEKKLIKDKVTGRGTSRSNYQDYLNVVDADKLAVICLHGVLGEIVKGEVVVGTLKVPEYKLPAGVLAQRLGEAVQHQVNLAMLEDRCKELALARGFKWRPAKRPDARQIAAFMEARGEQQDAFWQQEQRGKARPWARACGLRH